MSVVLKRWAEKTCDYCGKTFQPSSGRQKRCGNRTIRNSCSWHVMQQTRPAVCHKYYMANKDAIYLRTKKYIEANPETVKENHKNYERMRQERKRVEAAGGRERPNICDVCKRPGVIHWDHCHQSGKFRGWLCACCNTTLGHCDDSPQILRALAIYLEKNQ